VDAADQPIDDGWLTGDTTVVLGIDALRRERFAPLKDRRIGLITNHTGLDSEGNATVDLLHFAPNVRLTALFGPEHGIRGAVDAAVPDGRDATTGLPVYSLYGERTQPTHEQLASLDALIYDIQDIGTRFYTYISTLGLCLEAAAAARLPFVVLDRPNPINGVAVEGPVADADKLSFTAHHTLPVRHGLTVGEIARLLAAERHLTVDLQVVPLEGWRRQDYWDATGLTWTNPSPNMRSLTEALLYPGIGLLEFTNVSVGRGTDTPFERVGAPWIDGRALAHALNKLELPGVRFVPIRFTPIASKFAGQECGGINLIVVQRDRFIPVLTGLAVAVALHHLFPYSWEPANSLRLLANQRAFDRLLAGADARELVYSFVSDLRAFHARVAPHLLYH
jgi:uncharacterized protein YbbC (DUF1343 family)